MGARHDGRIIAFQTLYRYELTGAPLPELLDFSWMGEERQQNADVSSTAFASLLISGCVASLPAVDEVIRTHLEHWDFDRVGRVDLSALRLGVYCLLYQADIPREVTIDESVSIAKQFGSDESYRFVNGVLDGVNKNLAALREQLEPPITPDTLPVAGDGQE